MSFHFPGVGASAENCGAPELYRTRNLLLPVDLNHRIEDAFVVAPIACCHKEMWV